MCNTSQSFKRAPRNRKNKLQYVHPSKLKIGKNRHFPAFFGMGSLNKKVSKFNCANLDVRHVSIVQTSSEKSQKQIAIRTPFKIENRQKSAFFGVFGMGSLNKKVFKFNCANFDVRHVSIV